MPKRIILLLFPYLLWLSISFASEAQDLIAKGNSLVEEKKYQEALQEYEKALKADPKNVRAILLTGLTYANLGKLDEAISHTKKAVDLDPSYTSFYHLGMIYAAANDTSKALEAFDRALALSPDSFMAEYQKGLIYASLGEYEKAIESYQKALKLNPHLENAHVALAGSYLKLGDKDSALAQVEELRKIKQETLAQVLENRINEKTA